jgi:threonylcarbamoyladenosine tRNA methylthiotransferase MtaB
MRKVAFHTLGCKLNYAETASIGKGFTEAGFRTVDFSESADVYLINTCSVTENADKECRQIIRRALRHNPNAYVVVVGCYAQLRPEEVASIDGVDLVLGASEKFRLFEYVDSFQKNEYPLIYTTPINEVNDFGPADSGGWDRTRAFLKIQDGCDYNCSFCTIPLARGGSRSRPIDVTLLQARNLVQQGYKEIVLSGVNVGDYGRKIGTDFFTLLKELDTIDGLERIRISSIEPNLLTREMVDFVAQSQRVCNHFHIPLQSGHDAVLRLMRRRYTAQHYHELVHHIKATMPECGIGVDVIVGFPGETDAYFEHTYQFLLDLPVTYLHVFSYSERPETKALELEGIVKPQVRAQRSEMLRILGAKKKREFYEQHLGKTVSVLLEHEEQNGMMFGFTTNYVRVGVSYDDRLINQICEVHVNEIVDNVGIGEVLSQVDESVSVE